MNNIARNFIIPSSQNQIIQGKVINNPSLRKIAVAMNTNSAVAGLFQENSFNHQHGFELVSKFPFNCWEKISNSKQFVKFAIAGRHKGLNKLKF